MKALVRSERQKEALLNDRHSWVGIPVGYESELEMNFNESQIEPDNVSKLRRSSPYKSSTFQSSTADTSVSDSEDSVDVRDEIDTIVDNNDSSKVESKRITSKRTEKQILHEIDSLGFSSLAMDPILSTGAPPLGTFSYDPQTGRRIVHKGNNRWVGVLNPNFVVHYNNHFHGNGINQEEGNDGESRSASSTQESLDISLVGSSVQEHQSGAITMTNYSLQNENSMFLRQHKSLFMETFSHRSLSNYSGLHSTTYYDKLLITPSSHPLTNDDGIVMDNNNNGNSRMTSPFARKTIVPSSPHSKVTMRGGSIDDNNINKRELSSWTQLKNSTDRMIRMKGIDLENDSLPSDGDSISFKNQSYVANNKYNNYNNNEFLSAVDYDSDEEMWKSRSLYKPRKVVEPKVVVWKRPAQKHYKLKYSWLPQPLVHNAVNNLYYDKTVKDFYSDARRRNVTNFRKELLQGKDRYLFNYERSSLTEQLQQDGLHLPQQQLFSSILLHDEQQQKTNRIPSLRKQGYEVQRTKHNDHNQSLPANIVNNKNISVKSSEKSTTLSYLHRRASESNVNNNKHDHHLVIDSIKNNKDDNIEESSSQKLSADDVSSLGSATSTSSFYSIRSSSKKLQKSKNKKSDNFTLDVITSDLDDDDDDDDDDDVQDAANEIPSPQSNHFMINNRSTSSKRIGSLEADILRSKFKFSPSTSPTAADSSKLRRVASWY